MQCGRCSSDNPAGAKFCGQCGARLAIGLGEGALPRFVAPERYTPKHLSERILTTKRALEGERKQVTVLFADLKGSMELLADRDPEEARRLLAIVEHAWNALEKSGGQQLRGWSNSVKATLRTRLERATALRFVRE